MKAFSVLLTVAALLAPAAASAAYMCDKQFTKNHAISCPAGSTWDSTYGACIVNGG